MSQGRPQSHKSSTTKQRVNEQIRIPEVLVIDDKGVTRGVMPTKEAMKLADSVQLDLVEVAPNAKPPVCRIMDYGKYQYQQNKKAKSSQSNQIKIKEIRFRQNIGQHDLDVRINQARAFINDKCKVQVTLLFKGRHYDEVGEKIVQDVADALKDIARVDSAPKHMGKKIICVLAPLSMSKTSTSPDSPKNVSSAEEDAPHSEDAPRPAEDKPRTPRPVGDKPRPPRPAGDKPHRLDGSSRPNNGGNGGGSASKRPQ